MVDSIPHRRYQHVLISLMGRESPETHNLEQFYAGLEWIPAMQKLGSPGSNNGGNYQV